MNIFDQAHKAQVSGGYAGFNGQNNMYSQNMQAAAAKAGYGNNVAQYAADLARTGVNNVRMSDPLTGREFVQNLAKDQSAQQFVIKIQRLTANLSRNLDVVIGAAFQRASDYLKLINDTGYQGCFGGPSTLLLGGIDTDGDPLPRTTKTPADSLQFFYQDTAGAAGDIVQVSCNETPITSLLEAMKGGYYQLLGMQIKVPTANTSQLDIPVRPAAVSGLGATKFDTLTPSDYISRDQQQSNIVLIPEELRLDAQNGLIISTEATAGLTYTVTMYVKQSSIQG